MENIICCSCSLPILDRFMLEALSKFWHEDCLKCACCNCRLYELGFKFYYKQGMILCNRDYLRLFGLSGICSACYRNIPAYEVVMRVKSNVYHLQCFSCRVCYCRFCVGDKFYLHGDQIICQYDYEKRAQWLQSVFTSTQRYTELTSDEEQLIELESKSDYAGLENVICCKLLNSSDVVPMHQRADRFANMDYFDIVWWKMAQVHASQRIHKECVH